MPKKVLIIGHPLAAKENRLAYKSNSEIQYFFCVPSTWVSRGMKNKYVSLDKSETHLSTLKTFFSGFNSFYIWKNLTPLITQLKPDFIYCWGEAWCLSTFQIAQIATKLSIPFSFYSAENRPKRLLFPFTKIQAYVYQKATHAIAITLEVKKRLQSSGFKKPCFIMPLSIPHFAPLTPNPQNKEIAYVGRLIPLKRVDLLIDFLKQRPDYSLKIIGDGPTRKQLQEQTKHEQLQQRVHFVGTIDNNQLPLQLQTASVVVIPTSENNYQAEQFGKAALEAVMLGLPVITSHTGNYIDLEKEITTLYTVNLKIKNNLAKAIQNLENHYPNSLELSQSRDHVFLNYSHDHLCHKWNEHFLNNEK